MMTVCKLSDRTLISLKGLEVTTLEISEPVDGEIINTLYKAVYEINCDRFYNYKKEVNTIAMSPILYKYMLYVAQKQDTLGASAIDTKLKKLFDLKIILRDDFKIDQVDIYRDVTAEEI